MASSRYSTNYLRKGDETSGHARHGRPAGRGRVEKVKRSGKLLQLGGAIVVTGPAGESARFAIEKSPTSGPVARLWMPTQGRLER